MSSWMDSAASQVDSSPSSPSGGVNGGTGRRNSPATPRGASEGGEERRGPRLLWEGEHARGGRAYYGHLPPYSTARPALVACRHPATCQ